MKHVIIIDGSRGEGGGQVVRSALALSAMLQQPFVLQNVRAKRRKPGLQRQHLTAVRAAAATCGAEVAGDVLGSRQLEFYPGAIASAALKLMHDRKVNALLVVDDDAMVQGAFNMQDLLRAGVV